MSNPFSTDNYTGMYLSGTNQLSVSIDGKSKLIMNDTSSTLTTALSTGTNSLTSGAITSSGNFSNGGNNMNTGILTVNTLRGSGTTDTLFVDRSTVLTAGNRYYAVNCYFDSGSSDWRSASGTGYAHAISGQGTGPLLFISSTGSADVKDDPISMSTRLIIDPVAGNIRPQLPVSSTQSATFSSVLSNGTMSCGTHGLTCGAISSSGTISNGTNSLTTGTINSGAITSSGNFTNGTNALATGNITCRDISAAGSINTATNSISTGDISCRNITSTGDISNGTNSLTTGDISSSGNFNNGSNSLTTGAITSGGPVNCGTNSLTCGAISSGSISAGTNSLACGSITSSSLACAAITSTGNFSNGNNSMTTGILTVSTLRGSGTTDTLSIDRSTVLTSGSRYYSVNCYFDSNSSIWRSASNTGYAQAISGQGSGNLLFLVSSATSDGKDEPISMITRLIIDPTNNYIRPQMPVDSLNTAKFSHVLSTGRMACQQGSPLCVLASFPQGSTIAATTVESNVLGTGSVDGGTLPANSLAVGSVIKIKCISSVGLNENDNIRFAVKIGSVEVAISENMSHSQAQIFNDMIILECEGTVRSLGNLGTIMMSGIANSPDGFLRGGVNKSFTQATIDTTISNLITTTVKFSGNSADNHFQSEVYNIYTS